MPEIFWPVFLVVVGLAVVLLELMIPSGGILSAIAGIAMLASIVLAFIEGGVVLGTIFMGITAVLVPAIMLLFIRLWPRTPMGKRVLINPPPAEELVPEEVQSLRQWIGERGIAVSPMLPSGAIRIGHRTIDAISEGMSIDKGSPIEVVAARGNHLVVRPVAAEPFETEDSAGEKPLDTIVPDPFDDSLS